MARNKYPEETQKLILDTAERLFLEKGYDKTSIQDIISQLGGLSKGAIYYHFSSKEDIFVAVAERMGSNVEGMMRKIMAEKGLNGREKLTEMFRASIRQNQQRGLLRMAPDFFENSRFLASILYDSVENVAKNYIFPMVEEGIQDGSIRTDYPEELAEVLMLLANVWLNPMIFRDSRQKLVRKSKFYQRLLEDMGMPMIDEEIIRELEVFCQDFFDSRE